MSIPFKRWRNWQIVMFSGSCWMLVINALLYPVTRSTRYHGKFQLAEMGVGLVLMALSYLWPK